MSKKKDLKTQVEQQLSDMLESGEEPSEGRMKLLKLGMTMLAINAKLEENDFGGFFRDDEPGGVSQQPEGKKSGPRKRANGNGEPDA